MLPWGPRGLRDFPEIPRERGVSEPGCEPGCASAPRPAISREQGKTHGVKSLQRPPDTQSSGRVAAVLSCFTLEVSNRGREISRESPGCPRTEKVAEAELEHSHRSCREPPGSGSGQGAGWRRRLVRARPCPWSALYTLAATPSLCQ